MKTKNRTVLYLFLLIVALGVAYTACKDITPAQEHVENNLELKLSK